MLGRTHFIAGTATAALVAQEPSALALAGIGALMPDIDHPGGLAGHWTMDCLTKSQTVKTSPNGKRKEKKYACTKKVQIASVNLVQKSGNQGQAGWQKGSGATEMSPA